MDGMDFLGNFKFRFLWEQKKQEFEDEFLILEFVKFISKDFVIVLDSDR